MADLVLVAGDPKVLVADEPTGNLGSENGKAVMELLAELHSGGATIVMVPHDKRFNRFASRTIGLLDGRLVPEGLPAGVLTAHL